MIQPQLATPALVPPDGDRWLHEVQHEGHRIVAAVESGRVHLWSCSGAEYRRRAPGVAAEVGDLADDVMLDGELVVLRPNGAPDPEALAGALRGGGARVDLTYLVWDVLRLRGEWLFRSPLLERKERLARLLEGRVGPVRFVEHVTGRGPEVYLLACELGAPGIVSKRVDSVYRPGRRSQTWLQTKCWKEATFVVGGYTTQPTEPYPLGAVLLGVPDDEGRLRYVGRVSLGRSQRQAELVTDLLAGALQRRSPFATPSARGARWTRPELAARVRYLDTTPGGHIRHATLKEIAPRDPAI